MDHRSKNHLPLNLKALPAKAVYYAGREGQSEERFCIKDVGIDKGLRRTFLPDFGAALTFLKYLGRFQL